MYKVLHISTECYPAAKAGGMGDVLGSLPKYLSKHGVEADVVIPKYKTAWILEHKWTVVKKSKIQLDGIDIKYELHVVEEGVLPFSLYAIHIPGKFDRESIYVKEDGHGFVDELERNLLFQYAVLDSVEKAMPKYGLLHCHDHMTGFIPFMVDHLDKYKRLRHIPTMFTIHNGQYQGAFTYDKLKFLPKIAENLAGLIDWDNYINPLATAIKCAWKVNTVSPSYMQELINDFGSMTQLLQQEKGKCVGVLNGIDNEYWDPKSDQSIAMQMKKSVSAFKSANKKAITSAYGIKQSAPLFSFIGRLAFEKGADLIEDAILPILQKHKDVCFFLLGNGDVSMANQFESLQKAYPQNVAIFIGYDEALAHQIYAGSDFLLMPSRFEPCGLNQMYAMRYGTVPVVRSTGGLIDTVPDIANSGNGITFKDASTVDLMEAINRGRTFYKDKPVLNALRENLMTLDFSWDQSAATYAQHYSQLIKHSTYVS